jgi:hypothetical protein
MTAKQKPYAPGEMAQIIVRYIGQCNFDAYLAENEEAARHAEGPLADWS